MLGSCDVHGGWEGKTMDGVASFPELTETTTTSAWICHFLLLWIGLEVIEEDHTPRQLLERKSGSRGTVEVMFSTALATFNNTGASQFKIKPMSFSDLVID